MSDVLIRDLPEEVVASLDAQAARMDLSLNEYVRRELRVLAQRSSSPVTVDDLHRFARMLSDLADPEVKDQACR